MAKYPFSHDAVHIQFESVIGVECNNRLKFVCGTRARNQQGRFHTISSTSGNTTSIKCYITGAGEAPGPGSTNKLKSVIALNSNNRLKFNMNRIMRKWS